MAEVEISKFTPNGNDKYIKVDSEVIVIDGGDVITFKNMLAPRADVSIQFFSSPSSKTANTPENNFCGNNGTSLLIPAPTAGNNGEAICTVSKGMSGDAYLYTVSTPGGEYVTLDPVVIIDLPGPLIPFLTAVGLLVALFVGAVAMRMYMNSSSRKSGTPA